MIREAPEPARSVDELREEIGGRFGVVPNFFKLAPTSPAIAEAFFGLAKFAYLDSPLPSLFKERLFVHLSRFCEVRYCLARHFGFLIGLGRPSGDSACEPLSVEQAIAILKRSFTPHMQAEQHLAFLRGVVGPLVGDIKPDGELETALFAVSTAIFLSPGKSKPYLAILRRLLGDRYEYLLLFLGFVRTAHFWTQVHPELTEEEDISTLLTRLEEIAWGLAWDSQAGWSAVGRQILDDLRALKVYSAQRVTAP